MNFKSLFAVVSIALTLIACDESSSAPAEEVVNPASSETITSSDAVITSSESTTPTSSAVTINSSETAIASSESTTPISSAITVTSSETVAASSESVIASSETAILSSATVNTNITCTGEISDNEWVAHIDISTQGMTTITESAISFEGTTMTTKNTSRTDMVMESMCDAFMQISDMGEIADDPEADAIYGPIVGESEMRCEGSILILNETRVKTNVTDADREAAYNDTMTECKDLRDGKISIED
jgi:hypothetical protein